MTTPPPRVHSALAAASFLSPYKNVEGTTRKKKKSYGKVRDRTFRKAGDKKTARSWEFPRVRATLVSANSSIRADDREARYTLVEKAQGGGMSWGSSASCKCFKKVFIFVFVQLRCTYCNLSQQRGGIWGRQERMHAPIHPTFKLLHSPLLSYNSLRVLEGK